MEQLYEEMKERLEYLNSQEQTDEIKWRIAELTLSIVRIQQILLRNINYNKTISNLEITEIILKKYGIKYHKLVEGDYSYIMPFKENDVDGRIYVYGYGLIPLTKSEQFRDFIEFYKGNVASY